MNEYKHVPYIWERKDIPINIWDDYCEDGHVPEGEMQTTHIYIEAQNKEITEEQKKEMLIQIMKHIIKMDIPIILTLNYKNPVAVGGAYFENGWQIKVEKLTHKLREEVLLPNLQNSTIIHRINLSSGGQLEIPFRFYSES